MFDRQMYSKRQWLALTLVAFGSLRRKTTASFNGYPTEFLSDIHPGEHFIEAIRTFLIPRYFSTLIQN